MFNGGWLPPNSPLAQAAQPQDAASDDAASPATYQASSGDVLTLSSTSGVHVTLLAPSADTDPEAASGIVALFDSLYDANVALTGNTPAGDASLNGLLTLAVVPTSCGAGCVAVTATGIEMDAATLATLIDAVQNGADIDSVFTSAFASCFARSAAAAHPRDSAAGPAARFGVSAR